MYHRMQYVLINDRTSVSDINRIAAVVQGVMKDGDTIYGSPNAPCPLISSC
jgi:hypothetical protein